MFNGNGANSSDAPVVLHGAALIAQAKDVARERPDERIVGVVAEKDTPEAAHLLGIGARVNRARDGSVSALISRESAKKHLVNMTPQLLEWLEDDGEGSHRKLPVIHAARRGLRTTALEDDIFD